MGDADKAERIHKSYLKGIYALACTQMLERKKIAVLYCGAGAKPWADEILKPLVKSVRPVRSIKACCLEVCDGTATSGGTHQQILDPDVGRPIKSRGQIWGNVKDAANQLRSVVTRGCTCGDIEKTDHAKADSRVMWGGYLRLLGRRLFPRLPSAAEVSSLVNFGETPRFN